LKLLQHFDIFVGKEENVIIGFNTARLEQNEDLLPPAGSNGDEAEWNDFQWVMSEGSTPRA
jgi:hypothetical protein